MKNLSNTRQILACITALLVSVVGLRAEEHATFKVADFTFTRPAKWEWVETGANVMRKAQFKVPATEAKTNADVIFFLFPGGAGSVEANVDRWMGLFTEPREKINSKVETVTIGKTKVTFAHAEGTFLSGMPNGPKTPMSDYALDGAIIESDAGNIFVRLVGPKDVVKASVADFKKMIEGGLGKS